MNYTQREQVCEQSKDAQSLDQKYVARLKSCKLSIIKKAPLTCLMQRNGVISTN